MGVHKQLATAAELMAAKPLWIDHPCQSWGRTVRLCKLDPTAYLALSEQWEAYERNEAGEVSKGDRYAWAVAVVAATVVDGGGVLQFSDGAARQWLASEPSAVRELVDVALRMNGLGEVEDAAAGGEKKSDS
jgi:hypothetical protein